MHRYIIAAFLSFLVLPVMSAAASQPHGHHSVTLPKDCSAIMDQDNESAPALHYMTHAYKRCMDLSRKMIRQQKKRLMMKMHRILIKTMYYIIRIITQRIITA